MRKTSLFPIFLVYFLDTFSFAVVFPLFSSLLLTTQFDLLPLSENLTTRTLLLGALNASFPLALLIGAPIMGNLSDHFGRKRTFFITILATVLGNIGTALAIYTQNYILLLISRLFCGFFSGNLTLCLAAISDISLSDKVRSRNFGTLTAVGGLSWVLAMLAGGDLTLPSLNSGFSPSLPFWIIAAIGVGNLLILSAYFPETHRIKKPFSLRQLKIGHQIFQAFCTPHLRTLFVVQCLFLFGWLFVFQWFSGYTVARFGIARDITALSLSLIGGCWILGAALINRKVVKELPLKKIPLYGLILLSVLFIASSYAKSYLTLVIIDGLIALSASIVFANLFSLISLKARESIQGKVIGLSQSVMTIAQCSAPLIGTLMPIENVSLFYRISLFALLIALLIYRSEEKRLYAP